MSDAHIPSSITVSVTVNNTLMKHEETKILSEHSLQHDLTKAIKMFQYYGKETELIITIKPKKKGKL